MASAPNTASNELTPEELGAWRGLLRVHSALVKALDAELLAAHDLPLSSYEVLINLRAAPDRRRRMAVLTDAGEALLTRARATHLDGVRERFLRRFSEAELRQLAGFWNRVLPGSADLSQPD